MKKRNAYEQPVAKRGFTTAQAAEYIGMSTSYLRKARMQARDDLDAPPHTRIAGGRKIVYLRENLDAWLDAQATANSPSSESTE